jgi:peptidoglycan/LPS O-acetylase OafA/YrhL
MLLTRDWLLKVTGLAIAISVTTRVVFHEYQVLYFTLARLDGLAIGSALAIFARCRPGGLARFIAWAKRLMWLVGPALVLTQLLVSGRALPVVQAIKSTLISLIYACVLILAIENELGRTVAELLSGRVLGSVGQYSYGMYVLHPFVLSGLHMAGISYGVLGLILSILLTYAAALVSWTLLERRFIRLKRYFEANSNRRRESVSSSAAAVAS